MAKTRKVPVTLLILVIVKYLHKIPLHKEHGKIRVVNGINYEVIGGDMLLNMKTNRIEKI